MGCDSRVYIPDYGTEAGREGYCEEDVKGWKTGEKMGSVGTATCTAAAASLRKSFTARDSCHHKNVVMDKRFRNALDQTSPFDSGHNAQERQMSGSEKVADSLLPIDDTKHCPKLHRPTREMMR